MNAVAIRDDEISRAVTTGNAYRVFYAISALASASASSCYFVTPDDEKKRELRIVDFYASADKITLDIKMGVTSATGGSAVTPRNMNDNSSYTSGVTVANGATVTEGSPTTVETKYIGGTSGVGAHDLTEPFRVLKNNTKYSIKVTNGGSGAADIFIGLMLIEK